jgi:hypothetical protein
MHPHCRQAKGSLKRTGRHINELHTPIRHNREPRKKDPAPNKQVILTLRITPGGKTPAQQTLPHNPEHQRNTSAHEPDNNASVCPKHHCDKHQPDSKGQQLKATQQKESRRRPPPPLSPIIRVHGGHGREYAAAEDRSRQLVTHQNRHLNSPPARDVDWFKAIVVVAYRALLVEFVSVARP